MTWLLLGGGPTPALEPDARAATSQSTTSNISQLVEDDAAELDPRSRRVSPSITAVNDHALSRIMDECNVESLEDYDGYVADALPKNMETANIAPEAPELDCAAADGDIIALEASLASESAGVFYISLCVLHTRRAQDQ
jgi:hypothetical protein